jgi:hypothetical protein
MLVVSGQEMSEGGAVHTSLRMLQHELTSAAAGRGTII